MTISTVLSIISAALAIARFFITYAEQKKWMEAGAAQAALQGIQEADNAVTKARDARLAVRDQHARDPDSVMSDDEFKRKD